MRARSLAQASPEGPLPMTATLCPLRLMSGAGILSAFSIFQSPTKRSSLPIATGSPLTPKTQEPSHWLSCGQTRPQTLGSELSSEITAAAAAKLPSTT